MRIIYLSPTEPFPGTHAGFTHVYNLITNLCREGVEVILVAGEPQEGMEKSHIPDIDSIPGLTVHSIPRSNSVTRNIRALRTVLKILRKNDIDLIHERYEMAGGAGTAASLMKKIPLVLEVNDPLMELNAKPWQRPFLKTLRRIQYWRSHAIICQTPHIKGAIWAGYPRSKTRIFVIPNGADPSRFPHTPFPVTGGESGTEGAETGIEGAETGTKGAEIGTKGAEIGTKGAGTGTEGAETGTKGAGTGTEGAEKKRIGFIGNFMPWHGVRTLIRAFAEVRKEEPESQLLLIGNHRNHEDELGSLTWELGIQDHVEFTGAVPSDEVPHLLSGCRVLVAPFAPELDITRKEWYDRFGFWWSPLKIFEYMAAGRPVVSPKLGMIPTYLGDAGRVYPPGDESGLVTCLVELLGNDSLSKELGERGRERVGHHYNWTTIAHITRMVYMNVLEGLDRR